MAKKLLALILALSMCLIFAACNSESDENKPEDESKEETSEVSKEISKEESDVQKDTIPPAFTDAKDGKLPPVTHKVNEDVDISKDIKVCDNETPDGEIVLTIKDDGGYDKAVAGEYTIILEATDKAGNKATASMTVTVLPSNEAGNIEIGKGDIKVQYNQEDALEYTDAGTRFRSYDIIQVMEKDFFKEQYKKHSSEHTNNGKVPFFPNGVIVITDKDFTIIQVRIAAGANIQIEKDGTATDNVPWNSAIDAEKGGGMFKNFPKDLDKLIPDGGYVYMVGNPGEQLCRKFLIQNLFYSGYESGAIELSNKDMEIAGAKLIAPVGK